MLKSTIVKIKELLIIATLLFISSLSLPTTIRAATADGQFYLSPSSSTFTQGCHSEIHIYVYSGSNVSNAANIIVNFNTTEVEIIDSDPSLAGTQISPGTAYDAYADNTVDTINGKIRLTGAAFGNGFSGTDRFATIEFRSKPGATSTSFNIEFSGIGNTLDSNIADMTTSDDVLGLVGNGSYNFISGTCFTDTTPPTIEPISPQDYEENVPLDSNIVVEICDDSSGVDIESVIISINGEEYSYEDTGNFSYVESGSNCYTITINPSDTFPEDIPIFVIIKASDLKGNLSFETVIFNIPFEKIIHSQTIIEKLETLEKCEEDYEECQNEFTKCQETILKEVLQPSKGLLYLPLTGTAQMSFRTTLNATSIIVALISILLAFPSLFVKREKKPWGIVYDKKTRKPVAFATVRIYSKGKLKDQKVTDLEGRYGFLIEDGRYIVEVEHGNYKKASTEYTVTKSEPAIHLDIGLAPVSKKRIKFGHKIREKIANYREIYKQIATYTYSVGLILSFVALLERPTLFNQLVLAMYLIAGIIYGLVGMRKKAGKVVSTATQTGIAYASVRIFNADDRKLIDNQMTDSKGRYSFIVSPGKYLLHASMPGYSFPSEEQEGEIRKVFFGNVLEINIEKEKTLSLDLYMDPITQEKFRLLQEEAKKAIEEEPKKAQLRSPFAGE